MNSASTITYTTSDLADLASHFEARRAIAQDTSERAAYARDRHHHAGSAAAWSAAAQLINDLIAPALPREKPVFRIVAGSDVEGAQP